MVCFIAMKQLSLCLVIVFCLYDVVEGCLWHSSMSDVMYD